MNKRVEQILNKQIEGEASSSHLYLAMASWAETKGYSGAANFLYTHSDEERQHMLKLVKFVNERGGEAIIPPLKSDKVSFDSLTEVFTLLLNHEIEVTNSINEVVFICLEEKDYTTHNFMQWYVAEQLEEEALARNILDKLNMIDGDKSGIYMFDRDLEKIQVDSISNEQPN
ncbi:MAG: ferritin [Crocinitomicaceae bacterium]